MTFQSPAQRSRNSAPNSGLMKTPDYLTALVHKPLKRMEWRKEATIAAAERSRIDREEYREQQRLKAERARIRRKKLLDLERIVSIAKGKAEPEIIQVRQPEKAQPAYMRSPHRTQRLIKLFLAEVRMSRGDIFSRDRFKNIVKYRHMLMWFLRRNTKLSTTKIAGIFANRDHTTVIHACNKIDANDALLEEVRCIQTAVLFEEHQTYGEAAQ